MQEKYEKKTGWTAKELAVCAMMLSLALVLSRMERLIPVQMLVPLPGVKLGLANVVTLVALFLLGAPSAFLILLLRCLLGALFGGGITGLLFSLGGGILSFAVTLLACKMPGLSIYGVSILGAAAHNVGQIAVAMAVMGSWAVGAYLPFLLLTALAAGVATGAAAAGVLRIFWHAVYKDRV